MNNLLIGVIELFFSVELYISFDFRWFVLSSNGDFDVIWYIFLYYL